MAEIDRLLAAKPAPKLPKFTDQQIAEFLQHECRDFCDALTSDLEFARQEIQKRINRKDRSSKSLGTWRCFAQTMYWSKVLSIGGLSNTLLLRRPWQASS